MSVLKNRSVVFQCTFSVLQINSDHHFFPVGVDYQSTECPLLAWRGRGGLGHPQNIVMEAIVQFLSAGMGRKETQAKDIKSSWKHPHFLTSVIWLLSTYCFDTISAQKCIAVPELNLGQSSPRSDM